MSAVVLSAKDDSDDDDDDDVAANMEPRETSLYEVKILLN